MKIRFANDTKTPDGDFKAGSTHEVTNGQARSLIHRGKAVAVTFHGNPVGTRRRAKGNQSADPADTGSAAAETPTKTPPAKGKGKE